MPGTEEIIIRNGTILKWFEYALWKYFITFGKFRVRALWVYLATLVLVALVF